MEWTFHLKGALQIMKSYTQFNGISRQDIFSPQVLELVYNFFAENETFSATTGGSLNRRSDLQWSTQVQAMFPFLGSQSSKVRPCIGMSLELLDIISTITYLSSTRCRSENDSKETCLAFDKLQERIHRLQNLPERRDLEGLVSLHAAAFEEATWIYLEHAIQDEPLKSENIHKIHLPKLLGILQKIHDAQGSLLGFIPYPMWALFIASSSILEEERVKILEWFTILKCNKPISNVPSTMAAVEAIWKRRDMGIDVGQKSRSCHQYGLDWEAAISQLGWKMPLI